MNIDMSIAEREFLLKVRRTIASKIAPVYPAWREANTTPQEMFQIFGGEGLLGFRREGGSVEPVPWLLNIHLYKELAQFSGGLAIATFVQGQLGNQALHMFADDGQKKRYLLQGIEGERILAFANTEPSAGSDASAIKARAVDKGDHFIVNGRKAYITNGDIADTIIFTAVTDPKAERPHRGISMFAVDGEAKGLARSRMKKYGWKESHLSGLHFDDVRVEKEDLIGSLGRGFYQTMDVFNSSRIGIGALAFGAALGAYKTAYTHARKRSAFGKPLFEHESKRNEFAENLATLSAMWLLIQKAACLKDSGADFKHYASMAKLFSTEEGLKIANWASITLGARGIIQGNPVAEFPHDAKVALIGEGAPEVQKKIISENIDKVLSDL